MVFVVDATTDRARLEAVLTEATEQLSPASPNDEDSRGQIRFIPVDRIGFVECKSLVRAVCDAAAVA